jgi:ribonucleotide monophosphatase NagD (HAD superfamily)
VGDRVGSDLAAAAAADLDAALVRSEGADHDQLDGFEPQPVAIGETLAGLLTQRA